MKSLMQMTLMCLVLMIFCPVISALAAEDWKPVDPSHLSLKQPVVEKDADAEALFWEVRIADEDNGGEYRTVFNHYIRIKIFTERGREQQSTVELPYRERWNIKDIVGRTIKPDGSIVELKKDAVFDRTVIKFGKLKVKVKSFAMPGVEPGAIIEYKWKEFRPTSLYNRLEFQRDVPVQSVKYWIKPIQDSDFSMRAVPFQASPTPITKEKNGFHTTSMTNVPAFREEPRMPPEYTTRAWMLLYYTLFSDEGKQKDPAKYWKDLGKKDFEENKGAMKVNDDVRRVTAEAIGDATTPEQKLERILTWCRTKIKNIFDDASGITEADLKKLKENRNPGDTIKRGYGDSRNIDLLFAAMATAAGFESRLIRLSDRGDFFFDQGIPNEYFLDVFDIAVKVGDQWKFFDPSSKYVPFGMLSWRQEGVKALLSDGKESAFIDTPLSPPERSGEKTTGKFTLSEDGTLEGDAQIEYTGHLAVYAKEDNDDESPQQREEKLKEMLKRRLGAVEISNIQIENVTDPVKPFIYRFHLKMPGYASRTGKRLFVQPAFFQFGDKPLFPNSERKYPIYFEFPWMEESLVNIELPAGFALDNAESPASFNASDIVKCNYTLGVSKDNKNLVYSRKFRVNGMMFPVSSYAALKQVFDVLNKGDNHAVTLKQTAASGSN